MPEPFQAPTKNASDRAPLLEVRGLRRRFGGVVALDGFDVSVAQGTITALIGPNGAGKTTAFQCISGVLRADAGTVTFAGQDVSGSRPDRITRAGMIRSFQIARGIPRLSVMENLMLYSPNQPGERVGTALARRGRIAEEEARAAAAAIARRLGLLRLGNTPAASLSGGQKKLLEIGRALMARPSMILLDEPVAGVNPTLVGEIAQHLSTLRDEGMTFLVIEHHLDMVAQLCDPVVVMAEGRVLTEGSFAEVAANPMVQEAYMGRRRWS
jgi:ABC-type branched-subunit amino acid transport system ATPase component